MRCRCSFIEKLASLHEEHSSLSVYIEKVLQDVSYIIFKESHDSFPLFVGPFDEILI